ncbi:hypothetical protein JCM10213_006574 [Rhodosporidiobolus nylandii]
MLLSDLPIFPSSIPLPYAIAPAALPPHLQPRAPFTALSPNLPFPPSTAGPSSAASKSARPKKGAARGGGGARSKASSAAASGAEDGSPAPFSGEVPAYLAPDYTLNPAGPASNADTDFKCPQCDKIYRGKHARSIWRRHLQDKHGIPLSQQPRRTRWDNDANRPKSEEEKRARTLDSKRRWARKNRADKAGKVAAATSSLPAADSAASAGGSVGTPGSDVDPGEESADADSSFDATSTAGWTTEGAAAMNGLAGVGRGGSAPQLHQQPHAGPSNPFYPYAAPLSARKGSLAHLDGYGGRGQLRAAGSLPPAPYGAEPHGFAYEGETDALPIPPPQYHQQHYSHSPGNASPFHSSAAGANPYSHPFLPHPAALEQSHHYPPQHGIAPPAGLYDTAAAHGVNPLNPLLAPPPQQPIRRPLSNPNPALGLPNPYDHPTAGRHSPGPAPTLPAPPVLAGQIAPVANSYYSRRQSPTRLLPPQGLESPVKLGSARPKPSSLAINGAANGLSVANGKAKEHPREDAAGILLALKAGPSSPMSLAHVQSPVSNLRDRSDRGSSRSATSQHDAEEDDGNSSDDEQAVQAQLLMGAPLAPSARRAAALAQPVPNVSPQKRRRSESPGARLASTSSSSGGEGSTAAAHALLATAKKAHSVFGAGANRPSAVRGATWSHASLVATPTPGGLMQSMMESSPAVRYPQNGGAGAQESEEHGGDEEEDDGDLTRGGEEPFTSSSSGGRHRRGRSESPSRKSRRRAQGAGSSSSAAASSSSQPRPLHHHHPVGLTSELGDFDLQHHPSSSSGQRAHHHHDPLREEGEHSNAHLQTPAQPPRREGSSSSNGANGDAMLLSSIARPSQQQHMPPPLAHHHDPFLAHPTASAAGSLTLLAAGTASPHPTPSAAAHAAGIRTSSPPFGSYSSFLFSSPAHPQFSKTLGLTAAPGPGVLSYPYAAVGDTPASAAVRGRAPRDREFSNGSVISLDGVVSSARDRMDEIKTPVMARIAGIEGVAHRREPSDEDTYGEEQAEVYEDGVLGGEGEEDEEESESPERVEESTVEEEDEEE